MAVDPDDDDKRAAGGELVLPVAALGFTIYYFSTIWDSPWEAQVAAFLIGSILIGLIAILLVRFGRELMTGRADLGVEPLIGPVRVLPRRLAVFALTLGYLIGINWLGFTLTSFLFLFLSMTVLEDADKMLRRMPHFALVSAGLALAGYFAFIWGIDARFPRGPGEALLGALFGG